MRWKRGFQFAWVTPFVWVVGIAEFVVDVALHRLDRGRTSVLELELDRRALTLGLELTDKAAPTMKRDFAGLPELAQELSRSLRFRIVHRAVISKSGDRPLARLREEGCEVLFGPDSFTPVFH